MPGVAEVVVVLAVAALLAFMIHRFFPDSRDRRGEDLDDALYQGGVRGLWLLAALVALALRSYWLLR